MKNETFSVRKMECECDRVSSLLRALSHPQRLMVLGHLVKGRKTVSELQMLCKISQSQLSQFLNRMKLEGLLVSKKTGRYQYYSIADKQILRLIRSLHLIFCE